MAHGLPTYGSSSTGRPEVAAVGAHDNENIGEGYMAEEVEAPTGAEDGAEGEEVQPKKGGKMMSIVLLLVGVAAGSGAGLFLVGPLVAGGPADASEAASEDAADAGDGHGAPADDGHGAPAEISEDGVDPLLHTIPNVIVNPAGSGGNRFLLLDVALRLSNQEAVVELAGRDAEVRDAMIQLLGVMTVNELAEISTRDGIKADMSLMVSSLLIAGSVSAIFFPRYVIQ